MSILIKYDQSPEDAYCYLTAFYSNMTNIPLGFAVGGGDQWIYMGRLRARFRMDGEGGKSPQTFLALHKLNHAVRENPDQLSSLPLYSDFSASRYEDDSDILVTVSLNDRTRHCLTLERLKKGVGVDDFPCKETFAVPAACCPLPLLTAFANLAYAMLADNDATVRNKVVPQRPLMERFPTTQFDRELRDNLYAQELSLGN